jgi:flavin-dependent thymidylate synthase
MRIILAGYNIDAETIRTLRHGQPDGEEPTPETVAAAYARISRNPLSVDKLRAEARREVERARRSNRAIVFEMGHSSIAEHAVFNIDVLGVSRLLVEEIEKFRLCSYTEKSQRYVLFQDDFVLPGEIAPHGSLAEAFRAEVQGQYRFYRELYEHLRGAAVRKAGEPADAAMRAALEGLAKEDARYGICLATQTQLGMTINARNLELMIRRCAAHPLEEARAYGERLYEATNGIAPSLVRYTEATDYDTKTRAALRETAAGLIADSEERDPLPEGTEAVHLLEATPHADERLVAALLHSSSHLSLSRCRDLAARTGERGKTALLRAALRHLRAYDPVLREFEFVELLFELVVSAACFAQLKRHRMATITCQDYDPTLGVTVPPAVREAGMAGPFEDNAARARELYETIRRTVPAAAPYILTNGHRKRVLMKVNARELYHMTRLRSDRHAQWDIRATVDAMLAAARREMPLTLMLAAGKDAVPALQEALFPPPAGGGGV